MMRIDARPEPGDLRGIEANRVGELLLGELVGVAECEHLLEERRHHVRRRRGWAGEVHRVVLLVSVDDPAGGFQFVRFHRVPQRLASCSCVSVVTRRTRSTIQFRTRSARVMFKWCKPRLANGVFAPSRSMFSITVADPVAASGRAG